MAKFTEIVKNKTSMIYFISALLLIGFILFLIYRGDGTISTPSNDYKKVGYFHGGSGGSELDVRKVRWDKHVGFERIVFDVYQYNGVLGDKSYILTSDTGIYQIGKEKTDLLELYGELKGYRAFSAAIPSFSSSKYVEDLEVMPESDEILFTIKLKKSTPYRVFTLAHPARIVIDLKD